jgi:hypothetical protein
MSGKLLRQCNMLYLYDEGDKVKVWCEKKSKKSSINKCNKCIKKGEH